MVNGILAVVVLSDGSVYIDPLNPLCIGMKNTEGVRMNPCNLSESISWFSDELSFKIGRVRTA